MKKTILMAWALACAAAMGEPESTPQWIVQLAGGDLAQIEYEPGPIWVGTLAGDLEFGPEELERIDFAEGGAVVRTAIGDTWVGQVDRRQVARMAKDRRLREAVEQARSVAFPAAAPSQVDRAVGWTVAFANGGRVSVASAPEALRIETGGGRMEVPGHWVRSVRAVGADGSPEWVVELEPGGLGMRGNLAGGTWKTADLGGRALALPWTEVSGASRFGTEPPPAESLAFVQAVEIELSDGTVVAGNMPVWPLAIRGAGGSWTVPSTRVRQALRNPDGSFSVQTGVGEWLTGKLDMGSLSIEMGEEKRSVGLRDVAALRWAGEAVEMPEGHLTWRMKSGDLLVGGWLNRPQAAEKPSASILQVRATSTGGVGEVPAAVGGRWVDSAFEVRHWASGTTVRFASSMLEAVRAGKPEEMPPAVPPAGPSAVRSDERLMPAGSFRMGRLGGEGPRDEVPPVELALGAFWVAGTPTTVAQFGAFASAEKYVTDAERIPGMATWRAPGFPQRPEDPVVCVSWQDAARYCNWLSAVSGLQPCYDFRSRGREIVFLAGRNGYRLPLEAEWEYAARSGGQEVAYPWGDEADEKAMESLANFRLPSAALDPWPWTNPVKSFPPTAAGLYDVAGNVWEWCQDVYWEDAYLRLLRGEGLARMLNAERGADVRRSMRGGSYYNPPAFLRCAARGFGSQRMGAPRVGFRVVRSADEAVAAGGAP
jgi:formylglycine-generating enzyme